MKVRQLLAVVMVSAATAVGSVWGYGRYLASQDHTIGFVLADSKTSNAHFAPRDRCASEPRSTFPRTPNREKSGNGLLRHNLR